MNHHYSILCYTYFPNSKRIILNGFRNPFQLQTVQFTSVFNLKYANTVHKTQIRLPSKSRFSISVVQLLQVSLPTESLGNYFKFIYTANFPFRFPLKLHRKDYICLSYSIKKTLEVFQTCFMYRYRSRNLTLFIIIIN